MDLDICNSKLGGPCGCLILFIGKMVFFQRFTNYEDASQSICVELTNMEAWLEGI